MWRLVNQARMLYEALWYRGVSLDRRAERAWKRAFRRYLRRRALAERI